MEIKDWKEKWLAVPVDDFGISREEWVKKVERAAEQVETDIQFHMEEYVWQHKSGSLRAEDAAFDVQDKRLQAELQQGMPSRWQARQPATAGGGGEGTGPMGKGIPLVLEVSTTMATVLQPPPQRILQPQPLPQC